MAVQTPSTVNKSWVELCDEEENSPKLSKDVKESKLKITPDSKIGVVIKKELKDSEDENMISAVSPKEIKMENSGAKIGVIKRELKDSEDENMISAVSPKEIKMENSGAVRNFSYASVLKNSASKSNISSPKTPFKTSPSVSSDTNPVKSVKREIQREFLHEDLSISSHLDIFHMESPLKQESLMSSPLKMERATKRRNYQPKLMLDEDTVMADDLIMPSPKKITRLSTRRKRESGDSPLSCKRPKQSPGGRNTPRTVVSVGSPTPEFETDLQILTRRQKQIDYGKNTIGYERYCQMVPKDKRHKKHPHTPPRKIKYSRRAWDGLIKQWRQQLHFWDPPSEGGGNIGDLDMRSVSDTSSETMSHPSTPRDKQRPRRSTRLSVRSTASECSNITDDTGCSPLKN